MLDPGSDKGYPACCMVERFGYTLYCATMQADFLGCELWLPRCATVSLHHASKYTQLIARHCKLLTIVWLGDVAINMCNIPPDTHHEDI